MLIPSLGKFRAGAAAGNGARVHARFNDVIAGARG